MKTTNFTFLLTFLAFFAACKSDKTIPSGNIDSSGNIIYVINEGTYGQGNGDISLINLDSLKVTNSIFEIANGKPLGDLPFAMLNNGQESFIVVNNSQPTKIEVVETKSFVRKKIISGFGSPRSIIKVSDNIAFVSDLAQAKIHILNLTSKLIEGSIHTFKPVEDMIKSENRVFAANWSSQYIPCENNSLMVIDLNTHQVVDSLKLAKEPQSMVLDKNNKLWVICSGGWDNSEIPTLFRINPSTLAIEKEYKFPNINTSPVDIRTNPSKDKIYFVLNNAIYQMGITDAQLPTQPYLSGNFAYLYSYEIHPKTGEIFITDAKDFSQAGDLYHYNIQKELIKKYEVDVCPRKVIFGN